MPLLSPLFFRAPAILTIAAMATACGNPNYGETVELAWPEMQSLYRVDAARGQVEAFSLRSGITPLGQVKLPPTLCPESVALDVASNRLLLWSRQGGVAIDARSLKTVSSWTADDAAPPRLTGSGIYAMPLPDQTGCRSRVRVLHAQRETVMQN